MVHDVSIEGGRFPGETVRFTGNVGAGQVQWFEIEIRNEISVDGEIVDLYVGTCSFCANADGVDVAIHNPKGMEVAVMSVDWADLVARPTDVIKEQRKKIDGLMARIRELEAERENR